MKTKKTITPRCGTAGKPWLFWQRKVQVHPALRLIYKPEKWEKEYSNEKKIIIFEDYIYAVRQALKYKDRGYHKTHRKVRDAVKQKLKILKG